MHSRTVSLIGSEALEKLKNSRVAVFGIGGVGGYTAEALARAGVGTLDIIDSDRVSESNINRQLIALKSTVGMLKTDVMKARIADINPDIRVNCHNVFYLPEKGGDFDFGKFDYVADAIDTISGKIDIICRCKEAGVPVISAMGAGNKLDPGKFQVSDIYQTSVCPLARVMRYELKKRGIDSLKVVYSQEMPQKSENRSAPGSISFVPSVAGLIMAGEIIRDLTGVNTK